MVITDTEHAYTNHGDLIRMIHPALLTAIIRNANSMKMNRDLVGLSMEDEVGPFDKGEILAYAKATRDDDPAYAGGRPPLPPFYLSRLVFPYFRKIITHPRLGLNLLRMVHAEQSVTWKRQIWCDERLRIRGMISGIHDTPAGEMIEILGQIAGGGEVLIESRTGFIVRKKQGHFAKMQLVEDDSEEIFTRFIQTEEGQQREYARVSNDTNVIHTSGLLARAAGLPRTIMHGVCVLSMATGAMAGAVAGGDRSLLRGVSCRFAYPAFPGDRLRVVAYRPARYGEVPFTVFNESGRIVLKHCLFHVSAFHPSAPFTWG